MEPHPVPRPVELNKRIHASDARVVSIPLWISSPSQEESWLCHIGQFLLLLATASTPALTTACPHRSFMHSINLLEMHLGPQISIYLPLFHKKPETNHKSWAYTGSNPQHSFGQESGSPYVCWAALPHIWTKWELTVSRLCKCSATKDSCNYLLSDFILSALHGANVFRNSEDEKLREKTPFRAVSGHNREFWGKRKDGQRNWCPKNKHSAGKLASWAMECGAAVSLPKLPGVHSFLGMTVGKTGPSQAGCVSNLPKNSWTTTQLQGGKGEIGLLHPHFFAAHP